MDLRYAIASLFVPLCGCGPSVPSDLDILAGLPERVDYNLHVKPLLSDRCYAGHGADDNARQADLRLHTERGALHTRLVSGGRAVVPSSLRQSKVIERILSDDPEERMTPPESNLALSDYEKALIARWIEQGAEWKPHWAFPEVPEASGTVNAVDNFVFARLEREGLRPAPEADRERLLRRVTFDLTGLPPTIKAIDAFLDDDRPDAYERAVDRLLTSDAFGERLATEWMDVSRYADSHGYHADGIRTMWPWRDWVIEAFNDNMPFDEFVTWQLAGDLLPEATRDQILATAFHRNHPMTAEGGVNDEEYRMEYVVDRTNTTATAFLGMTLECARCHDHKFDPISQKDYYRFAAFFNNVKELGMTGDDGNAGPMLTLLNDEEEASLDRIRSDIEAKEHALARRRGAVRGAGLHRAFRPRQASLSRGLAQHYPLDAVAGKTTPNLAGGEPGTVAGPRGKAFRFDDDYDYLELKKAGLYERNTPFSATVWIRPEEGRAYTKILGNAFGKNTYWRGWELFIDCLDHAAARVTHALPHNYLHVRTEETVNVSEWTHVALTYDGSSRAGGLRIFLNGRRAPSVIEYDRLYRSIHPIDHTHENTDLAVRVGRSYRAFGGNDGIFRSDMDDIRLYDRELTAVEAALLAGAESASVAEEDLLEAFLHLDDESYRRLLRDLEGARAVKQALLHGALEVMVMEEMDEPRTTYVLDRGLYDRPAERVKAGVPAAFGAFPDSLPTDRLAARGISRPWTCLVEGLSCGIARELAAVHLPHDGAVPGLPAGSVVETPAVVYRSGLHPRRGPAARGRSGPSEAADERQRAFGGSIRLRVARDAAAGPAPRAHHVIPTAARSRC